MTSFTSFLTISLLVTGIHLAGTVRNVRGQGQALYLERCATCHGADLMGGNGSNLIDGQWAFGGTRSDIIGNIREGIVDRGMPPFGEMMTDAQIRQVVDYILDVARGTASAAPPVPDSLTSLDYDLDAEIFAHGLEIPWAIDFIDERTVLVTERPGRLRIVESGRLLPNAVAGIPVALHEGQGGLLDVAVDPNVEQNGWIYLSYSHLLPGPDSLAMTRLVRGRIRDNRWVDEEVLFEAPHEMYIETRHHYGSRIVFDPAGHLFFSIGDRGRQDMAQDLSRPNGKVHRIWPDGSIPQDNPFVHVPGALPSIYSYGHRNPQGLAVNPETGDVWEVEHGPRGGDELNRVQPGRNYGWPVISYGINYSGTVMTEFRRRPGMVQPVVYWRPSIAVSGLSYYSGASFGDWRGRLLASALAYEEVRLLHVEDGRVIHQEVILKDAGRVREAVEGPDGAIYVVLNEPDVILRLAPRERRWR